MGPFEYLEPSTIEEVLDLLGKFGDQAKLMAGGTDLTPMMKEKTATPQYVISLQGCSANLNYIRCDDGKGAQIAALTTIRDIERSHHLQPEYTVLCETASQLASMPIRNMATIGGNLCNASPSADTAPTLIALSATVKLVSTNGERIVPLEQFFTGPGLTVLKSNELMTEIQVPAPSTYSGGVYVKYSTRGGQDLALVGIAVLVALDPKHEVCTHTRVVLGAAAPTPMRSHEAEEILTGRRVDEQLIARAAQAASDESRPIADIRGSAEYRREMIKVFTGCAIRQAVERAQSAARSQ